jgi:glucose/arabinose dehydrogenase
MVQKTAQVGMVLTLVFVGLLALTSLSGAPTTALASRKPTPTRTPPPPPTPTATPALPVSGNWSPTGSLTTARHRHTMTLLSDGRVLVAGGSSGGAQASAEIYTPASGTWTPTGSLTTFRSLHTATLLTDGRVLAAGGLGNGTLASAELFTP